MPPLVWKATFSKWGCWPLAHILMNRNVGVASPWNSHMALACALWFSSTVDINVMFWEAVQASAPLRRWEKPCFPLGPARCFPITVLAISTKLCHVHCTYEAAPFPWILEALLNCSRVGEKKHPSHCGGFWALVSIRSAILLFFLVPKLGFGWSRHDAKHPIWLSNFSEPAELLT